MALTGDQGPVPPLIGHGRSMAASASHPHGSMTPYPHRPHRCALPSWGGWNRHPNTWSVAHRRRRMSVGRRQRSEDHEPARPRGSSSGPGRLELLVRHRFWIQGLVDALAWVPALLGAAILRFEFDLSRVDVPRTLVLAAIAAAAQFAVGVASGLYLGRWSYGSSKRWRRWPGRPPPPWRSRSSSTPSLARCWSRTAAIIIAAALVMGIQTSVRYLWRLSGTQRSDRPAMTSPGSSSSGPAVAASSWCGPCSPAPKARTCRLRSSTTTRPGGA